MKTATWFLLVFLFDPKVKDPNNPYAGSIERVAIPMTGKMSDSCRYNKKYDVWQYKAEIEGLNHYDADVECVTYNHWRGISK